MRQAAVRELRAMAEANGVHADHPALSPCRDNGGAGESALPGAIVRVDATIGTTTSTMRRVEHAFTHHGEVWLVLLPWISSGRATRSRCGRLRAGVAGRPRWPV